MNKGISVLFSGGPDSTLAALYALEEADVVHLITYHHRMMTRIGKHKIVVTELQEKFGKDRVIEHEDSINRLWRRCYFEGVKKRLFKYRTYYIPWLCGACKLAMHIKTIAYNKDNGIYVTYDGANAESAPFFPAQTSDYIKIMKGFYSSFNMTYDCPVYDVGPTDKRAESMGIPSMKDTKKEHVFARFYYRPFRGRDRVAELSGAFLADIIDEIPDISEERRL
jgi:hypothetical protein